MDGKIGLCERQHFLSYTKKISNDNWTKIGSCEPIYRHLNSQKKDPRRIKKADKQYIKKLEYTDIVLPISQKQYDKIEKQNSIRINIFGYENEEPCLIHISKETFEDQMNLLLITEDEKKHYILIKDFDKFMYNRSRHKERKHFCMYCLSFFIRKHLKEAHQQLFNNQW